MEFNFFEKIVRIYEDGTKVEIQREKLAIFVYDKRNKKRFEITGFESLDDINLFLDFSDFNEGKGNDFYTIAGKTTELIWQEEG
jgi:hypothetical protein